MSLRGIRFHHSHHRRLQSEFSPVWTIWLLS